MKTKLIITVIISVIIASLSLWCYSLNAQLSISKNECTTLKSQLKIMNDTYVSLSNSYDEISKKKTYSISLSPTINNKVNSAFGSTKNVTLQYYFTMDGNSIELKPDSVLEYKK